MSEECTMPEGCRIHGPRDDAGEHVVEVDQINEAVARHS